MAAIVGTKWKSILRFGAALLPKNSKMHCKRSRPKSTFNILKHLFILNSNSKIVFLYLLTAVALQRKLKFFWAGHAVDSKIADHKNKWHVYMLSCLPNYVGPVQICMTRCVQICKKKKKQSSPRISSYYLYTHRLCTDSYLHSTWSTTYILTD